MKGRWRVRKLPGAEIIRCFYVLGNTIWENILWGELWKGRGKERKVKTEKLTRCRNYQMFVCAREYHMREYFRGELWKGREMKKEGENWRNYQVQKLSGVTMCLGIPHEGMFWRGDKMKVKTEEITRLLNHQVSLCAKEYNMRVLFLGGRWKEGKDWGNYRVQKLSGVLMCQGIPHEEHFGTLTFQIREQFDTLTFYNSS